MSGYFDDATRAVTDLCHAHQDDALIEAVAYVENEMIAQVNLDTGDREFPDDLRERIQGIIAIWNVGYHVRPEGFDAEAWHKKGREWLLTVKESRLISDLHSAYHEVASRRIRTRFGMLYDSPRGNVKMRDEWDKGEPDCVSCGQPYDKHHDGTEQCPDEHGQFDFKLSNGVRSQYLSPDVARQNKESQ